MIASTPEPWLRLVVPASFWRRKWIRLRYSVGFFDDPARPLIRFTTRDDDNIVQVMNGPVLGTGEWIGRIPDGARSISISPSARAGSFRFRLDSVEAVGRPQLFIRGLLYDRMSLAQSIGARIIQASEERWDTLRFAATATRIGHYYKWVDKLARPLEQHDLDRPRFAWGSGPSLTLLLVLRGTVAQLDRTLQSLREQAYERWNCVGIEVADTSRELAESFLNARRSDTRLRVASETSSAIRQAISDTEFAGFTGLGDELPPYALACVAEESRRSPLIRLFYGDEDQIDVETQRRSFPRFKPNWDPMFFAGGASLGRLTVMDHSLFEATLGQVPNDGVPDEADMLRIAVGLISAQEIGHIRRILYHQQAGPGRLPGRREGRAQARRTGPGREVSPKVSIVIPTRNRPQLLDGCLKSVERRTNYPNYEVILVDNGSTNARALEIIDRWQARKGVSVVERPGPFNFSSLCNAGAKRAAGEVLLFLNNDIIAIDPDWLGAMVGCLRDPSVGIVGAKLLFPDWTIEHAGVVIGHGGYAGHVHHRESADVPGYMGALRLTRRVAAVTGACLAIKRSVFETIGGFDEVNFPVDLNDIDLCLRAGAAGFHCVWTPDAILYHLQSASRGMPLRPSKLYRKERQCFHQRWLDLIRDDPHFHPALSLYSHKLALA